MLRLQAVSAADLRDAVRQGLPFSAFEELARQLEISPQRCSVILGIPPRTVARRKDGDPRDGTTALSKSNRQLRR